MKELKDSKVKMVWVSQDFTLKIYTDSLYKSNLEYISTIFDYFIKFV